MGYVKRQRMKETKTLLSNFAKILQVYVSKLEKIFETLQFQTPWY